MRALVNTANPANPAEIRDVAEPAPSSSELLLEVRAGAINRGELRLMEGRPEGWRPGQDIAGVVLRRAADGSGPAEGTRVVALVDQAGWAERAASSTARVAVLPDSVSFEAAATLPIAGLTALRALRLGGSLLGRRVLVTGAAGGVGHFAVQLAVRDGASVTAVVGRAERGVGLASFGAEQVVVGTDDLQGPFDLALESAGGASFAACMRCCSQGGTVVVFGNSSGEETPISFRNLGDAHVRGFHVYASGDRPTFGEDLKTLVSLIASGDLRPQVGYEGSWRDPRPAFEALRGRNVSGKAVLRID